MPLAQLCSTRAMSTVLGPCALRKRIVDLSDFPEDSIDDLLKNFRLAGAHPSVVERLSMPAVSTTPQLQTRLPVVTGVIRCHEVFQIAIQRALPQVPAPPSFNLRMRPAWTNSAACLHTVICLPHTMISRAVALMSLRRGYHCHHCCIMLQYNFLLVASVRCLHEIIFWN